MADIKNYLKEREKREQKEQKEKQEPNQLNYKEKIKNHKIKTIYRILLIVAAFGIVAVLIMMQYKRQIYTDYEVISSIPIEESKEAVDVRLFDSILTYSKDGAHCTNVKGEVVWNQTYEIQDIKMDICQNVVAIGGYNERNIYVQSTEKTLATITTTMPIRDLTVSTTGNVTAVLADTDVTWINTYNTEGEMIYEGEAYMHDGGYPVAVSLSPNGELLAVSYIYIDAGTLKTTITFYNFGPVGSNVSDHIVGVYHYTDLLVPELEFINDETAFAVGDSRLMFYKGSQKPKLQAEHLYNREIQSVFYSDNYVGLVFVSDNGTNKYQINIYNTNAELVNTCYFDIEYRDIFFEEGNIVIYNEMECVILTIEGIEKYNHDFSEAVNLMLPVNGRYKYTLVTDDSIDTIQLK